MDWTYNYMYCYIDYPPLKLKRKMHYGHERGSSDHLPLMEIASETNYTKKKPIFKTKMKKKMKKSTAIATSTTPPMENMKPKPGTSKPSGAGVGRGGPKQSPTDGGSLKPRGGKGKTPKKGK